MSIVGLRTPARQLMPDSPDPGCFTSECIPTDPSLLTPERYRDFLAERRRLIAERLNDFLVP